MSHQVPGRVSVILIFRDEERFLPEAIASVRDQSYPQWELLLVDDGSVDRSAEIAREAAHEDADRVRYLTHEDGGNRGMSASRNLGLGNASGEYVAFLDGDDVYLPDRLMRHVEILGACPRAGMVQSDHVRWRSWASPDAGRRSDFVRPFFAVGDQLLEAPLGLARILHVPYLTAGICNVTVRTELARSVGGFVDAFSSLFEDQAFVARVSLHHPVYILQAYLALYRSHEESATRTLAEGGAAGALHADAFAREFHDWLIRTLEEDPRDSVKALLDLARRRRRDLTATPFRRMTRSFAGAVKRAVHRHAPSNLQEALARADQRLASRQAERAYRRMTLRMTRLALEEASVGERRTLPVGAVRP